MYIHLWKSSFIVAVFCFYILAGARSFGHFSLSMSTEKSQQSSDHCLHSIDLSPVTPWMFFVNRPFLFFLTSVDSYLLIGQMLTAKIRSRTTAEFFSKMWTNRLALTNITMFETINVRLWEVQECMCCMFVDVKSTSNESF